MVNNQIYRYGNISELITRIRTAYSVIVTSSMTSHTDDECIRWGDWTNLKSGSKEYTKILLSGSYSADQLLRYEDIGICNCNNNSCSGNCSGNCSSNSCGGGCGGGGCSGNSCGGGCSGDGCSGDGCSGDTDDCSDDQCTGYNGWQGNFFCSQYNNFSTSKCSTWTGLLSCYAYDNSTNKCTSVECVAWYCDLNKCSSHWGLSRSIPVPSDISHSYDDWF